MEVSIILVNYNTLNLLINCIDSIIAKSSGFSYEIIVVDNYSDDHSKVILYQKYGNDIRYIGLSENLGFGRANNEGIKLAKGQNILFLNPDTLLLNNAIKILNDYLIDHSDVGVVGGNIYDANMKPTHSFGRLFPAAFHEFSLLFRNMPEKIFYRKNLEFNKTGRPLCVSYITGAMLMIRGEIVKNMGGFDSDFFMYFEDTELCYRIHKMGLFIVNIPQAEIIHLEGKSFANNSIKRFERLIAGRKIFYTKTQSVTSKIIGDVFFAISLFIKCVIFMYDPVRSKYYKEMTKAFFKYK